MSAFVAIVARELRLAFARGGAWLPILFYLIVAVLIPLAVGPDRVMLGRVGGGMAWVAALLAALLPLERLVATDVAGGTLDQWRARGLSVELVAAAKIVGHWLAFAPPLLLATLPASGLLGLPGAALLRLEAGLLIGTPALAALAVATASVTAGLAGASALGGAVMLPLALPLLIFGTGALSGAPGAFKLLAAASLLLVAGAPFVAGAALRARD